MSIVSEALLIRRKSWFDVWFDTGHPDDIPDWFEAKYPRAIPLECSNKLNLCVIYSVWGSDKSFVQCLYWSLFSQQKFTDIKSADVKVFCSTSQLEYTKELLRRFKVEIIEVDEWFSKFSILTHPSLSDYKYVVNLDVDLFFVGNKTNLYKKIVDLDIKTVGMVPTTQLSAKSMISIHRNRFTSSHDSPTKYVHNHAKALKISDKELARRIDAASWHHSYFYVCNMEFFRNETWNELVTYTKKIESFSDETIMLFYAHENITDLSTSLMENGIKLSMGVSGLELVKYPPCEFLSIIHPSHSSYQGLFFQNLEMLSSEYADRRIIAGIIEHMFIERPEVLPTNCASYRRPIRLGHRDRIEGPYFTKLSPSSRIRIVCLGCSYSHFHHGGWPYFLSRTLSRDYEVVDVARFGFGISAFLEISDLLMSYQPDYVICQAMETRRVITSGEQLKRYRSNLDAWISDDDTLEVKASKITSLWFHQQFNTLRKHEPLHHDLEIENIKKLKETFDCPVIMMANRVDYPYYGRDIDVWEHIDLTTYFSGIEYSTYGPYLRSGAWHPNVKRSQEEAVQIADLLNLNKAGSKRVARFDLNLNNDE